MKALIIGQGVNKDHPFFASKHGFSCFTSKGLCPPSAPHDWDAQSEIKPGQVHQHWHQKWESNSRRACMGIIQSGAHYVFWWIDIMYWSYFKLGQLVQMNIMFVVAEQIFSWYLQSTWRYFISFKFPSVCFFRMHFNPQKIFFPICIHTNNIISCLNLLWRILLWVNQPILLC